ncbi:hypothetical protein ACJMK2_024137 [Sinanodonta woodiana]|uniref:Uncharacterized protein n=1 Tax=Sinanodonta woodiana TaxID=1069815 RepID=A0ABD3T7S3_SINWO
MSGKSERDYKKVFRAVQSSEPVVTSFDADFEAWIRKGLPSMFHDPAIHGRVFHFTQAMWINVQEKGQQVAYNSMDDVHKLLRKVFALPFLLAEDIAPAFRQLRLKGTASKDLVKCMNYVHDMWITSSIWDVTSLSVYGRSL